MKKYLLSISLIGGLICATNGQKLDSALTISGYAEIYYNYDFQRPSGNIPAFLYNFNRHNEVNINLGFIKAGYNTQNVRANLAIATGTYMVSNYTNEPSVLKNIYEANVGVKLSKKHEIWLDAGIMPSHIGFESAIGKDCWTLSRGMLAENSPYFETGLKLSKNTEKWTFAAFLLNGWQRIQRLDGSNTPSVGAQIQYHPSDKFIFNYSNFIGSDKPDSAKLMRVFHNFYSIFNINEKLATIIGCDIGTEQKQPNSRALNTWFTPIFILKYMISTKTALAIRTEYFGDKNGVIIATNTPDGFQTMGYSANFDYKITDRTLWRVEFRQLNSRNAIFKTPNGSASKRNAFLTSSLSVSF